MLEHTKVYTEIYNNYESPYLNTKIQKSKLISTIHTRCEYDLGRHLRRGLLVGMHIASSHELRPD